MVLANSGDSTSTLVSLDHHELKRINSLYSFPANASQEQEKVFRKTDLKLPQEEGLDDYWCEAPNPTAPQALYLPVNSTAGVDESLKCMPALMDTRDQLLSVAPVHYNTASTSQRLLYVGQGEIAHCLPTQNDILFSDKATTCHIVALRSTSANSSQPLCTLTHVDDTSYTDCIRAAVAQHHKHHSSQQQQQHVIDMDVHVMGGFEDTNGSSRDISNWLLHLLADLATEYAASIVMTLRTVCVTCMNDDCGISPLGRGLALCCKTGEVHLCKSSDFTVGPEPVLRAARLWSQHTEQTLNLIFTQHSDTLTLKPFNFCPFQGLDSLLKLPDDVLIQYCSTSPDCEEDDFVQSLRQTLHLLQDGSCTRVFGPKVDRALVYSRRGNTWFT